LNQITEKLADVTTLTTIYQGMKEKNAKVEATGSQSTKTRLPMKNALTKSLLC